MNYDKTLARIFSNNFAYHKFNQNIEQYINIFNYIYNRFDDSESIKESVYRIRYLCDDSINKDIIDKIEHKPKCPECGNPVKFKFRKTKMFTKYCSNKCSGKSKITIQLKKNTQLEHYGNECCYNSLKYQQDLYNKSGVLYHTDKEDAKQKRKNTLLKKYGTTNIYDIPGLREKISLKLKENNHKCSAYGNSSRLEEFAYVLIRRKYDKVIRQYPLNDGLKRTWDFYIEDINTVIEIQGSQYHHYHPFDTNNPIDVNELNKLKTLNSIKIIKQWTIEDPYKREYAKSNNIKLIELWNTEDIIRFVKGNTNITIAKLLNEYKIIKKLSFYDENQKLATNYICSFFKFNHIDSSLLFKAKYFVESNKLKNKIIYCKSYAEYEILGLLSSGATIYVDCFINDFDDMLKSMISFFKLNKQILYKRKNRLQVYDATFESQIKKENN